MLCSSCGAITLEPVVMCPTCGAALPAGGYLAAIIRTEQLVRNARYDEAGPELVKAEAELKRTALAPEARRIAEARLLANRARVLFYKSQYRQAEDLAQQALALLDDNPALALLRANALSICGIVANYHEDRSTARRYINLAIAEARQAGEPFMLGTVLNALANNTRSEGDNDAALLLYQEALQCAEQAQSLSLAATASSNMANVYQERGEMRTSLSFNLKASKLTEQGADKLRNLYVAINLGISYMILGELDTAETYLQKVYRFAAVNANSTMYISVCTNFAELAFLRREYDKAYTMAVNVTDNMLDDFRAHVTSYALQTHCAVGLGNLGKAKEAYDQLTEERKMRPAPSSNDNYYLVLTAAAAIKLAEHDWEAAQAEFEVAIERADTQGDVYSQAQVRLMYAEALLTHQTNAAQQAQQLLDEAGAIFTRMGASQNVQRVKMLLAASPSAV